MANVQIPNLPAVASVSGDELIEAVQAGVSVKVNLRQVASVASPWAVLTQVEYDALSPKDPNTVYLIVG